MSHINRASQLPWSPPTNFALVERGVYRSAYPVEANVGYLHHVGIKTVALLSIEALPGSVRKTLEKPYAMVQPGTQHPASGKNDPLYRSDDNHAEEVAIRVVQVANLHSWQNESTSCGDDFSQQDVQQAMDLAVDTWWHPVLFACPTGELQTNVVVGCMRRQQSWALSAIFSECELFTNLTRQLRSSVMCFIAYWNPEDNPISTPEVLLRRRAWYTKGRAIQTQRRKHAFSDDDLPSNEVSDSSATNADDNEQSTSVTSHTQRRNSLSDRSSLTPPSADLRPISAPLLNSEAAALCTSGQRPPAALRRTVSSIERPQAATLADESSVFLKHPRHHRRLERVQLAHWFLQAEENRIQRLHLSVQGSSSLLYPSTNHSTSELPSPHVRYANVRNPPALDERSSFTKESVVEEDDD